jgi:hypothetical protein
VPGRRDRIRAALASPRGRRVGVTSLVVVLLLATATAFAVTQRLKLDRSPVTAPRFDRVIGPTCDCERARGLFGLRLRVRDRVDVTIVNASGDDVRTLARDLPRPPGPVAFRWDGRDGDGDVVPDGRYRLRIRLREEGQTITVPTEIRVDSTPPGIRLVFARPLVISPDRDRRSDSVRYVYRVEQGARPFVVVEGEDAVRGLLRPARRGLLRWWGRLEGEPVRPGIYETWLVAEDEAGNRSEPTDTVPVRVRFVEVDAPTRFRLSTGMPLAFTVDADAATVEWSLTRARGGPRGPHGETKPGRVSIPAASLDVGRDVLEASANGRRDRVAVRVTR